MDQTNHPNEPDTNIRRGDLLQLRVTNSSVSEKFPMFKYMVVRDEHPLYYSCEDLSLKPVDIEGNEISIEKGKKGEGNPYKIKLEQNKDNNDRKMVSKDFVNNTHDQYALLMNYSNYRPSYVGDLFDAVPVGIEELEDRIDSLTPATSQHIIDSYISQKELVMDYGCRLLPGWFGSWNLRYRCCHSSLWEYTCWCYDMWNWWDFLSAGAGMIAGGVPMENSAKDSLENIKTNDNKFFC